MPYLVAEFGPKTWMTSTEHCLSNSVQSWSNQSAFCPGLGRNWPHWVDVGPNLVDPCPNLVEAKYNILGCAPNVGCLAESLECKPKFEVPNPSAGASERTQGGARTRRLIRPWGACEGMKSIPARQRWPARLWAQTGVPQSTQDAARLAPPASALDCEHDPSAGREVDEDRPLCLRPRECGTPPQGPSALGEAPGRRYPTNSRGKRRRAAARCRPRPRPMDALGGSVGSSRPTQHRDAGCATRTRRTALVELERVPSRESGDSEVTACTRVATLAQCRLILESWARALGACVVPPAACSHPPAAIAAIAASCSRTSRPCLDFLCQTCLDKVFYPELEQPARARSPPRPSPTASSVAAISPTHTWRDLLRHRRGGPPSSWSPTPSAPTREPPSGPLTYRTALQSDREPHPSSWRTSSTDFWTGSSSGHSC